MHKNHSSSSEESKLCHKFKLDWIYPRLVEKLVEDNKDSEITLKTKQRVKETGVTELENTQDQKLKFSEAYNQLKTFKSDQKALFITPQQLSNLKPTEKTIRKIEPWFKFDSRFDLQRCFLFKVSGMNEAQVFVKTDGAWIGLHAEDCFMSSFNFNVGPGDSEWTIIAYTSFDILSKATVKHCNIKNKKDLRKLWQHFFYSDEFLESNGIKYEKIIQKPGEAVFVPGNSIHQVINRGMGVNIAWNICLFTFETIDNIMFGYNLEKLTLKQIPQVPVLRVIHSMLTHYRSLFGRAELTKMAIFLRSQLEIEIRAEQIACLDCSVNKNKVSSEQITQLPVNCCMSCGSLLYLTIFVFQENNRDVFVCPLCLANINKGQEFRKQFVCNPTEVYNMLTKTINSSIGISQEAFDLADCSYLRHKGENIQRFDDPKSEATTLQVIRQANKSEFRELKIQRETAKLTKRAFHLEKTKNQPMICLLQRIIERNNIALAQLKRVKND